ncbi:MAG: helix-turn-helix transcriptional regulator [Candidatus Thorarchaeota archaeon]
MRATKQWVQDRVLVLLDHNPSYGYELIDHLGTEYGNIRLNTLYRWLGEMESKNLVESEVISGPKGPNRKIYRLTQRGKKRTTRVLRDAISHVLSVYCSFRKHAYPDYLDSFDLKDYGMENGRILYAAFPRITDVDIKILCRLSEKRNGLPIDILGDAEELVKSEICHRSVEGNPWDIPTPDERFSEVWLSGLIDKKIIHRAAKESKRILKPGGILRIVAPYVSVESKQAPSLGEFILVTAANLFPELGVFESNELEDILRSNFGTFDSLQLYPDMLIYSARK